MDGRHLTREIIRASLAATCALFLAGAAVSTRLHLRIARHGGGFAALEVLEQGLEIAAGFCLFVLAAALIVTGLARTWSPPRAQRLTTAVATFALAFLLFQMVFWVADGFAVLYLASGALAYGLVAGKPRHPPRAAAGSPADMVAPTPPTGDVRDGPTRPPSFGPSNV